MSNALPFFYVSCIGGLEEIVAEELAERAPAAQITKCEFGRVYFSYTGPVASLLALRTIEHVHAYVQVIEGVRHDTEWLVDLETIFANTDLLPALEILRQVRDIPTRPSFRVTAFRHGQHEFTSPEAGAAAGAGIVERYGWPVDLTSHELDVRLEIRDDRALVGLRLSPEALHHRSRVVHMRASLNPTVAAAMVRLSTPEIGERVLDPMCGAGTLLTERFQHDPAVNLVAGDLYTEKLALAEVNFAAFGVLAHLFRADARTLPVQTGTIDKVLCNLPWGRVVANPRLNRRLYPGLLGEMERVLRPGGLGLLLTSERTLMERTLARREGLSLERSIQLHVGGLEPSLYVTRRV